MSEILRGKQKGCAAPCWPISGSPSNEEERIVLPEGKISSGLRYARAFPLLMKRNMKK